jgi:hypothetical protein
MVLGDSFTFAQVTRTEDLFTLRLEDLLKEQGEPYEVTNAGVPGYGNSQEFLLMKSLADDGVMADIYLPRRVFNRIPCYRTSRRFAA